MIDHPNLAYVAIPNTIIYHESLLIKLIPRTEAYGWHFQYLTIIGLCMATLTNLVGLAADISLSSRLFAVKNMLLVCSAPMEVLISILYWGLRIVSPAWQFLA